MERRTGKKAPCFAMDAVTGDGEDFVRLDLDRYRGQWLILFFYPMDFTFVCPTELTRFSEDFDRFHKAGAALLAVSTDSKYCHQAWIRNGLGKLNYPLAADKTMSVSSDYGVLLEDEGIALRGLFIIDPEQTVRYSVVHDNNVGRNTDEIFRILCALQTNALCGANWTVGSNPLTPSHSPDNTDTVSAETAKGDAYPVPDSDIRLYTMPDCSYCRQIKNYLKSFNIPFKEINLETDEDGQNFMENRGYTALPVTVIGGHEISGFRLDRIKELLKL